MSNPPSDRAIKEAIKTMAVVRGLSSQITTRLTEVSEKAGLCPTPLPFRDTGRTMLTGEAAFEIQLLNNEVQNKLLALTNALRDMVEMEHVSMTETHRAFSQSWLALLHETRKELAAQKED